MRLIARNWKFFLLLLLAPACLISCRSDHSPEVSKKNEVTIGATDVMITINPLLATDEASHVIQLEVWQSLNQIDPDSLRLTPVLATLPAISADGHTLSYTLDSQARWSDGHPVQPEDVIFTFKSVLNPFAHVDMYRSNFDKLDSVWSPQWGTVCFHYSSIKFNRDYDISSIFILPKHLLDSGCLTDRISWMDLRSTKPSSVLKQAGEEFAATETSPDLHLAVGSGPYVFEEWERAQLVKLRKNPNYWAEKIPGLEAYPERLIYRKIADGNACVVALKAQDIDLAGVSAGDYLHAFDSDRWSFIRRDTVYRVNYSYVIWNNERAPFTSKNVRKALTMLMDRDTMVRVLLHGLARKVEGPVSPLQPGWDSSVHQPGYDPVAAERLLAEDGWTASEEDGKLYKTIGGKLVPLQFTIQSTGKSSVILMFIEALRKVGIQANLMIFDFATVLENVRNGRYDAYFGAEGDDPVEPDFSEQYHSRNGSAGGSNKCRYSNPICDSLIEKIEIEQDRNARFAMSHQLQHIIMDDLPVTFLFSFPVRVAWVDRFDNVRMHALAPFVDPRFFVVRN
jgi:peptide/nickel transport system substrate-binding protein